MTRRLLAGAVAGILWLAATLLVAAYRAVRKVTTRTVPFAYVLLPRCRWPRYRRFPGAYRQQDRQPASLPERRRMGRAQRERIFRVLLATDGPYCQICHNRRGPLLLAAHHHHPLAPEVHHVIPFSEGGPCALENSVLAHRVCNQETGTEVLAHLVDHVSYREAA